jgi:hypothetical protein
LKKKRRVFVLVFIIAALVIWLWINPPGRFGFCTFGLTTYNCIPRPLSDLQVRSDGKTRKSEKTHDLKMEHVQWLLEPKPQILIIGTGWDGAVKPQADIQKIKDCDVRILKTEEAVKEFNQIKRNNKKVAIHIHSTC